MLNQDIFSLVQSITDKEIDYAEIYFEEEEFTHIFYEDRRIEPIVQRKQEGYGLRFFKNIPDSETQTYYLSSNEKNNLKPQIEKILNREIEFNSTSQRLPQFREGKHQIKKFTENYSIEEKINLLKQTEETARMVSNEIVQVSLHYGEKKKRIWFYNSDGDAITEERTYLFFSIETVAKRDNLIQTASEVNGGLVGYEIFEQVIPQMVAKKVAQRAVAKLSAPSAPVGEMPVILSSSAGGTMIHEAIGHSLEADSVQKGISPVYSGKIGQKVANEIITVIDDPTLPNKNGSYLFDDEGTKAQETILIENCILKNYLYDRYTARKDKCFSNAHGRRESYHSKPIPRMANTYVLPGKGEPEKIIHSVEKGLLVKKMGGGQVNTATGDFVFEVEEGYSIKNGKIGPLIRGAVLLGNGVEVLQSIDLVGIDLGWSIGLCGKDGQGVPVSDGLPTLRIKKLLVGGTEKT